MVVRVLDSICVQNFHQLIVALVSLLFLELIWTIWTVHIDNKRKDILIHVKGPTPELNDTTLTPEARYSIIVSRSNRNFCLSLYYNWRKSFIFVNATTIYQFKAKDSEIKKHLLCLRNISRNFSGNKTKKQDYMGVFTIFLLITRILNLLILLTFIKNVKKTWHEIMSQLINHTKCVLLSNQRFFTQSTLITLHHNEYSQELHYYRFAVN